MRRSNDVNAYANLLLAPGSNVFPPLDLNESEFAKSLADDRLVPECWLNVYRLKRKEARAFWLSSITKPRRID